ncbi:hypothetical protein [Campylobacter sp.]|uniref:hypothetical protein n=1 Tax=Campylobacter sp. TaxID=205 RepID=UPI00403E64F3
MGAKKQNELIIKDVKQHERLIKLYDYIKYMDNLYSSKYPEIYNRAKKAGASEYFENERLHRITSQILYWQILTNRYKKIDDFCQADKNMYLRILSAGF